MATIVIVPGAWHGGWRWKEVRRALQAAGHEVYALTPTGLGERSHLASPAISLDTWMQDVVNVLAYEDLRDVVLVGHSFGGMVLPAVADRAAARLARRIYLDALLPRAGECSYDLFPPEVRAEEEEAARLHGEGWRIPPSPGADWRDAVPPQALPAAAAPHGGRGRHGPGGLHPLHGEDRLGLLWPVRRPGAGAGLAGVRVGDRP